MTVAHTTDRIPQGVAAVLACPNCHTRLQFGPDELDCPCCGSSFPVTATGVPILLGNLSEFDPRECLSQTTETKTSVGRSRAKHSLRHLLPQTTPYQLTRVFLEEAIDHVGIGGPVINIGSGGRDKSYGSGWINVDITPTSHCHVVADGHQLPFADDCAGAVVATNVFEYLRNPFSAAREIERILKPGGYLFVSAAFILPLSTPKYIDRFRFTGDGLRSLFVDLKFEQVGVSAGPFVAIARVIDRALDVGLPRIASLPTRFIAGWLLQPFKFLDVLIIRRDLKCLGASSFFALGRKPKVSEPSKVHHRRSGSANSETPG